MSSHRGMGYRFICKVCGAARWPYCDYALCEKHFLEYMRVSARACYRRKMAQQGREVRGKSR